MADALAFAIVALDAASSMLADAAQNLRMRFSAACLLAAGFADHLCHGAASIETKGASA
jgi:hypothetical protein